MLLPRFTLRSILAATTAAAVFFLLVGAGFRGQSWAWGAAIGIASLGVSILVQAALFAIVWCFARFSSGRSTTGRSNTARVASLASSYEGTTP